MKKVLIILFLVVILSCNREETESKTPIVVEVKKDTLLEWSNKEGDYLIKEWIFLANNNSGEIPEKEWKSRYAEWKVRQKRLSEKFK